MTDQPLEPEPLTPDEEKFAAAVEEALAWLADHSVKALWSSNWDTSVLDVRWPAWEAKVTDLLDPLLTDQFMAGFDEQWGILTGSSGALTAAVDPLGSSQVHLATVHNRMVGIGDNVFRTITDEMNAARQEIGAYESIDKLGQRVENVLKEEGAATWRNRGVTVARTEVIGAHNAGKWHAAHDMADALGEDPQAVAKTWRASMDDRTRPSHASASGQQVIGMDSPFSVGGSSLMYPGDPSGPAGEVINCRCWVEYVYPGDPGYPTDTEPATAATTTTAEQEAWMQAAEDEPFATLKSWRTTDQTWRPAVDAYEAANPLDPGTEGWRRYMSNSDAMNGLLRGGPADASAARSVEGFDTFFTRHGITAETDLTVSRYIRPTPDWNPGDVYKPGAIVPENAYTSTTSLPLGAPGQGASTWNMTIRVPPGTRYVHGTSFESEVILKRGTGFRVLRVDETNQHIYAEAVSP